MNIDVDVQYPPILVDLFKHGALGGAYEEHNLLQNAGDRAFEDMRRLPWPRCRKLIRELAGKVLSPVQAAQITDDHLDVICQGIRSQELESVRQVLLDTHTLAWMEALVPSDKEIALAVAYAKKTVRQELARRDYWDHVIRLPYDPPPSLKDWSPDRIWTPEELRVSASEQFSFRHEEGKEERFLVFDFAKMPQVIGLLNKLVTLSESDAGWIVDDLKEQFADWAEYYTTLVTEFLLRNSAVTAGGAVDFDGHWSKMMEDLPDKESLRSEILGVTGI
jgi:hypothetical protein